MGLQNIFWRRPDPVVGAGGIRLRLILAFILAVGHVFVVGNPAAHAMTTVIVNSTGDGSDLNPGDDVCSTGGINADALPECTLRAALQEANAPLGMIDEIHFGIPVGDPGFGAGVYVIEPGLVLPWVTQSVTIDGTTQPGFTDTPIVVLDGSSALPSIGGTDGLLLDSDGSTVRGLVVRDYADDGIEIHGDDNTIVGNHLFNNDTGVLVENAEDNTVGGLADADRNVISDNINRGVVVYASNRTVVQGNYIGVSVGGTASLGNQGHGVHVEVGSLDTTIGRANVISGNTGSGIRVDDAGGTTSIIGNLVGSDATGSTAIANGQNGISVGGAAGLVDIGGPSSAHRNVISGNTEHGIDLEFGADVVTIRNNRIGTNAAGTAGVGNGDDGVRADSDAVVIEDNLISGNGVDGVRVERLNAVLRGNLIGTDLNGTGAIPNGDDGVDTGSGTVGTTIGGTGSGEGNSIAFNADDGIVLRTHAGTSASIVSNSIFANGGLGIDLGDNGPTPNDTNDLDLGPPNGLLNFPVITSAAETAGTVYVDFELDVPVGSYRIEFFTNPTGTDPTGYGEGEIFVGAIDVTHITLGTDSYTFTYPGTDGVSLTATTTTCVTVACVAFTATSEFSATETVVVGNHNPVLDAIGDKFVDELSLLTFDATATDEDSGDALTFSLSGAPTGASISTAGTFTWTPTEAQGPGVYIFDVIVTDDGTPNLDDTETISVTVTETNQAPALNSIGDQTVDEGNELTFTASATDPDDPANNLTFSLSGEPTGAALDPDTGEFTWTPTETQGPGVYTFDVIVIDDGTPNLDDTETISVTVDEVNQPPTVTTPSDQANAEGDGVTLTVVASDPDVPADALSFSASDLPTGLVISATSGVISGTISYSASGSSPFSVVVTVTDDGSPNLQTQVGFTWTVSDTNRPPTLSAIGNQTVAEQTELTFVANATDADAGDGLTFSLSGQPGGAVIDPNTGVFSWTTTEGQGPGSYTLDVVVRDNGSPNLEDRETITVNVNEVNRSPVVTPLANRHDAEGAWVTVAVVASDPDTPANTLSYGATGLPTGLAINGSSGVITGTIGYETSTGSPYFVTITVADDGSPSMQTTESFTWTIDDVNRPPTISPIPNAVVDEETTIQLAVTATDPDVTDSLTFGLSGPPSGLTIDPITGVLNWTPTETQGPGVYTFSVTVADDRAPILTDTYELTITVREVNRPPVPLDDLVLVAEDQAVVVDVLANDSDPDLPANPLQVTAAGPSAAGTVVLGGSQQVGFTPTQDFNGITSFDYRVTDGQTTRTATVTVVVIPVNDAPVAGPDRYRLTSFKAVELDVLHNDRDVDGDHLSLTLGSLPGVGRVEVFGDQILYEPHNGWTGTVTFSYFVTDPSGARSEATVTLSIDDDVLTGAQRLADRLGVGSIPFESASPTFGITGLKNILSMDGITLLAEAFFQTVKALRIPLSFLGLTLLVVVGFGSVTRVPALIFGVQRRHWAVVLLSQQQRLPAYSEPMGRRAIYNFEPTASGIVSTGKPKKIGKTEWLPIDTPNGDGWLYREYLTEQVDLEAFMADPKPVELVHKLVKRLRNGEDVTPLLSRRGLVVALTGSPTQIPREHLGDFLNGSRLRHLRLSATARGEDFRIAVAEPFIEAYEATSEITAETPHSKTALIPAECWNFPYLALGAEQGVQPWLVFFEYRNGKASIAGLGIDE